LHETKHGKTITLCNHKRKEVDVNESHPLSSPKSLILVLLEQEGYEVYITMMEEECESSYQKLILKHYEK
jgi:hypothetical protein